MGATDSWTNVLRRHPRILAAGVLLHLLAAYFSVGYYSADEHFQIYEFAGLKLGFNHADELPWEFPARMRPALQPALAVVAIRAMESVGVDSPFTQAAALRFVSAILSFGCMLLLFRAFCGELHTERYRKWFLFLSVLLWFLPFQHARFSSETWSGLTFFAGLALLWPTLKAKAGSRRAAIDLTVGALLGLSFLFRFQAGLLIAPLALWLLLRARPGAARLMSLAAGMAVVLAFGACVDRWFYGEWTWPAWNYLWLNLVEGKAANFGSHPWWTYLFFVFRHGIFPLSVLMLAAFVLLWIYRPGHVLSWTTFTFVLVHVLIGHKELRFLFPLCNIVPFVLVYAAQLWSDDARLGRWTEWGRRWRPALLAVVIAVNTVALLFASLKPAEPLVYLFKHIYEHVDADKSAVAYTGENPYGRVQILASLYPKLPAMLAERIDERGMIPLIINFYRHQKLPLVQLKNADEVKAYADSTGRQVLLAWHRLKLDGEMAGVSGTRMYCYLPDWVTRLNFTDWTSRTQVWTLYGM